MQLLPELKRLRKSKDASLNEMKARLTVKSNLGIMSIMPNSINSHTYADDRRYVGSYAPYKAVKIQYMTVLNINKKFVLRN